MPAINDKHHLMRTFCSVAHFHSFSKAGAYLGLPVSSVSKNIKQLEEQLKTQLIIRNTRAMNLTDAGLLYYEKGSKILKKVDELEQEIHSLRENSKGKLRISLPVMLGEQLLAPLIWEFMAKNLDLTLELDFSHEPKDLIKQDFDVVFRTSSTLPDSSLFEVTLLTLQPVFVAAPDYLLTYGKPLQPGELIKHRRLLFHAEMDTSFAPSALEDIEQHAYKLVSNSHQSLIGAAIIGGGIACVYDVFVQEQLQAKSLVQILKHHLPEKRYLSVLYRQRGSTSKKIQSFIDYLKQHTVFKRKR